MGPLALTRFVLVAVLATTALACSPETPTDEPMPASLPDWLVRVYPEPGSEGSAVQEIQVEHSAITEERAVRLLVDGVDITTYSTGTAPGLLQYQPEQLDAEPVTLSPGEHTARAELLNVRPGTGEEYEIIEVLDAFEWHFTIL